MELNMQTVGTPPKFSLKSFLIIFYLVPKIPFFVNPPNILHLKVNKITNSLFFSFFRVELLALLH